MRRVLRDTRHIWQEEAVGRYGRHYGAGGEFIAAGGVWWRSAADNDTTGTEDGSRDRVCSMQREAAIYGIEAMESLIKAFKTNGSKTEMENLQAGLDKWRELRDYC